MRFFRQGLTGIFLLSLTAALLVVALQLVIGALQSRIANERPVPPARERVFSVNVLLAGLETVTPELTAFGEVQSRRTLELRGSAPGRVIWLSPQMVDGGSVVAGARLLAIDPADAQASSDGAQNDLRDAEAEQRDAARGLSLARDELRAAAAQADLRDRAAQRQDDLLGRGVGTAAAQETAALAASSADQAVLSRRQAVAQAEARVDLAATRLARTRIALEKAQRDLDETEVFAPFSGTLSEVTVVEGRLVSANEKIARLVDPRALEVSFRVSTIQYSRLLDTDGVLLPAPVTVSLGGTGAALHAAGAVSRDSAGSGSSRTGRQLFASLGPARGLKPGDFVTVTVDEPPIERVARLPASALGTGGTVLVLGDDDRLETLEVEVLRRQGDDILVRGRGLAGREVVTGRTPLLGPGIKAKPLRADGAGNAASVSAPEAPDMVELTDDRRARLVAFVEGNRRMPTEAKQRVLQVLTGNPVPARLVLRLEQRMGG